MVGNTEGEAYLEAFREMVSLALRVSEGKTSMADALLEVRPEQLRLGIKDLDSSGSVLTAHWSSVVPDESTAAAVGRLFAAYGILCYQSDEHHPARKFMEVAEDIFEGEGLSVELALCVIWLSRIPGGPDAGSGDLDWAMAVLSYSGEGRLADFWKGFSADQGHGPGQLIPTSPRGLRSGPMLAGNDPLLIVSEDSEKEASRLELHFKNREALTIYENISETQGDEEVSVRARLRTASLKARFGESDAAITVLEGLSSGISTDRPLPLLAEIYEHQVAVLVNNASFEQALNVCRKLMDTYSSLADEGRYATTQLKELAIRATSGPGTSWLSPFVEIVLADVSSSAEGLLGAYAKLKVAHCLPALSGTDVSLMQHIQGLLRGIRSSSQGCQRLVIASYIEEGDALDLSGESQQALEAFSKAGTLADKNGYGPLKEKVQRRKLLQQVNTRGRSPSIVFPRIRTTSRTGRVTQVALNDSPPTRDSLAKEIRKVDQRMGWSWGDKASLKLQIIQRYLGFHVDVPVVLETAVGIEDLLSRTGTHGGDLWTWARVCRLTALAELMDSDEKYRRDAYDLINERLPQGTASPKFLYQWHLVKSRVLLLGSDTQGAIEELEEAIDTLESYRASLPKPDLFRYQFFRQLLPTLRTLVAQVLSTNISDSRKTELFTNFTGLMKGRTFEELFQTGGRHRYTALSALQSDDLLALREEYVKSTVSANADQKTVAQSRYLQEIYPQEPVPSFSSRNAPDFNEVRSNLSEGQALLELFHEGGKVYLHLLKKEGTPRLEVRDFDPKHLDQALNQIMTWESAGGPQRLGYLRTGSWNSVAKTLGESISQVCQGTDITELYVVPHRELCFLPLSAFHFETPDGKTSYLGDQWPMMVLPSTSSLSKLRPYKGIPEASKAVAFFDPEEDDQVHKLPNTKFEVELLRHLFSDDSVTSFSGKDASLRNFKKNWTQGKVLLMATHAEAERDAYLSYLKLHAQDRVFSHDIFNLPGHLSDTELVVLSACRTGIADSRVMDESIGLMSSFLVAGAKMVLATYWQVEDRTASMVIGKFLEEVVTKGTSPARALSIATSEVRERHSHPYFWAPFFLMGRH